MRRARPCKRRGGGHLVVERGEDARQRRHDGLGVLHAGRSHPQRRHDPRLKFVRGLAVDRHPLERANKLPEVSESSVCLGVLRSELLLCCKPARK